MIDLKGKMMTKDELAEELEGLFEHFNLDVGEKAFEYWHRDLSGFTANELKAGVLKYVDERDNTNHRDKPSPKRIKNSVLLCSTKGKTIEKQTKTIDEFAEECFQWWLDSNPKAVQCKNKWFMWVCKEWIRSCVLTQADSVSFKLSFTSRRALNILDDESYNNIVAIGKKICWLNLHNGFMDAEGTKSHFIGAPLLIQNYNIKIPKEIWVNFDFSPQGEEEEGGLEDALSSAFKP